MWLVFYILHETKNWIISHVFLSRASRVDIQIRLHIAHMFLDILLIFLQLRLIRRLTRSTEYHTEISRNCVLMVKAVMQPNPTNAAESLCCPLQRLLSTPVVSDILSTSTSHLFTHLQILWAFAISYFPTCISIHTLSNSFHISTLSYCSSAF